MRTCTYPVGADDHIGPPDRTTRVAVGAGFYPARAVGTIVFMIPFGEFVFALREG